MSRNIDTIHDIFRQLWDQARRVIPVTVVSAFPLSDVQATTLAQTLARRTGATIQLARNIDPELIAGMVLTIGDRVIDASARTTLAELREAMAGA